MDDGRGSRPGLNAPAGIAIDPRGSVYVSDPGNARLVHFWGDATYLGELGGPAELGGAQLNDAGSVAVGPSGEIYVADSGHNRVLIYSPTGTLQGRWGAAEGDGAAGRGPGQFDHPDAVAVDGAGDVYVADTDNNRIVKLSPGGAVLDEWGSRGTGVGRFRSPTGIALDAAGRVYVVDSENNRVQVFDAGGNPLARWGLRGVGLGEFSQPTAIAVDCNGDVYVADTNNNRVQRFEPAAPAPTGCEAAGTWPPPLDVAPVVRVAVPRIDGVLRRRALALAVSCARGCKILVTATLSPLGRPARIPLVAAARSLPSSVTGHVRLLLGPRSLRTLQRALGRRRLMRARVQIVAAGPTGRRTTITRTYIVGR